MALIEVQVPLALRAEAHALLADVVLRTSTRAQLRGRRTAIERHLTEAHRCAEAAERSAEAEQMAALLAMARRVCADRLRHRKA
jgi:hypothetical protein